MFSRMMSELGEEVYMSRFTTERFCGEFVFYPFSSQYPTLSPRFYATASLGSRSQQWCSLSYAPRTTFEGVGPSKTDKWHMERCSVSCCQREYLLGLLYSGKCRLASAETLLDPCEKGNNNGTVDSMINQQHHSQL